MHTELITRIKKYCEREGIAESTFGWKAANNYRLMEQLNGGGSVTMKTFQKVTAFLDAAEAAREPAQ